MKEIRPEKRLRAAGLRADAIKETCVQSCQLFGSDEKAIQRAAVLLALLKDTRPTYFLKEGYLNQLIQRLYQGEVELDLAESLFFAPYASLCESLAKIDLLIKRYNPFDHIDPSRHSDQRWDRQLFVDFFRMVSNGTR